MKEKVVIWGIGNIGKQTMDYKWTFEDCIDVVAIIDNNKRAWNTKINGMTVHCPDDIKKIQFDKIVIASIDYFDDIEKQLIEELGVDKKKIENHMYFAKSKLIARYKNSQNDEIKKVVDFLKVNYLDVFNYDFVKKYSKMDVEINYDLNCGLYYVVHNDKKMYMARRFNTKEKVYKYYREISIEQDKNSPHVYLDDEFNIKIGDVVVDIGVAEGNFALSVIERASKVYLIEPDQEWIEALNYTFHEYRDKIIIINKFISDYTYYNVDTLDDLIDEKVDFIKMDIEGAEIEAIKGASKLMKRSSKVKCAICAYHRDNDEFCIKKMIESLGFKCKAVEGYMYYPIDAKQLYISPILRKGVIRCGK